MRTHNPLPISEILCPSTVTDALVTRCINAFISKKSKFPVKRRKRKQNLVDLREATVRNFKIHSN